MSTKMKWNSQNRFCVYVNFIHNIQIERDNNFISSAYRRVQVKCNKSFKRFESPKDLTFSLKFKGKKWVGDIPSLRWS